MVYTILFRENPVSDLSVKKKIFAYRSKPSSRPSDIAAQTVKFNMMLQKSAYEIRICYSPSWMGPLSLLYIFFFDKTIKGFCK